LPSARIGDNFLAYPAAHPLQFAATKGMQMKKLLPFFIGLSLGGFSFASQAEDLLQVYQQARLSNPDLRSAAADRDSAFEKINEARSPLLPQLGLGADYAYNNGYRDSSGLHSNTTTELVCASWDAAAVMEPLSTTATQARSSSRVIFTRLLSLLSKSARFDEGVQVQA